jgi:hypothetical protein
MQWMSKGFQGSVLLNWRFPSIPNFSKVPMALLEGIGTIDIMNLKM